jgi:SAM-dependent methyltransferase
VCRPCRAAPPLCGAPPARVGKRTLRPSSRHGYEGFFGWPNVGFVTVKDHYDLMVREMDDPSHPVTDPFTDDGRLREWLELADGPDFFATLGDVTGQDVLEIGIGTGRVAAKMLQSGCGHLVGLDISPLSLERAHSNLAEFDRVELVLTDIVDFLRPDAFDVIYSVWTLCHLEDAQAALTAAVGCLKDGGRIVLSVEQVDDVLDYGTRRVKLCRYAPEQIAQWLRERDCRVHTIVPVTTGDGNLITTIVGADRQSPRRWSNWNGNGGVVN